MTLLGEANHPDSVGMMDCEHKMRILQRNRLVRFVWPHKLFLAFPDCIVIEPVYKQRLSNNLLHSNLWKRKTTHLRTFAIHENLGVVTGYDIIDALCGF
jgi:hypothetical protein